MSKVRIAWGLAVLWLAPVVGIAYLIRLAGVADGPMAVIASVWLWSTTLIGVLFPSGLPKRVGKLAAVAFALALVDASFTEQASADKFS